METWLNLENKIIIVTGGASGIGLAIVDELLAQGAKVQMVDIYSGDKHADYNNYTFRATDISSASEVNKTISEIIQQCGRIDGLVNNSGINFPRLLVDEKNLQVSTNRMKRHLKKWSILTGKAYF
ncbi:MAG: Sulfoquinovose 1-dehydrogenase [Candidatus Erwinia impunctatus]|nr:Sulfoquinovose 1-dehydrogenase [Culicoides impunctatus]